MSRRTSGRRAYHAIQPDVVFLRPRSDRVYEPGIQAVRALLSMRASTPVKFGKAVNLDDHDLDDSPIT